MTRRTAARPATVTEPSRRTPVHGEFDVVVVGGGPAGIMAAAAAARTGHATILLERYGFLGGAGTAGGLSTFCGLHANVHGEHRRVIHGLAAQRPPGGGVCGAAAPGAGLIDLPCPVCTGPAALATSFTSFEPFSVALCLKYPHQTK